MSKVVKKLIGVFSCFAVYLHSNIVFKQTIVAREDDRVNRRKDVVGRVTGLSEIEIPIFPVDGQRVVVEDCQVTLADCKVAGDLAY